MRRLFIIRKDLHLTGGKLAAMVGHCCEAYWTNLLRKCSVDNTVQVLDDKHKFRFIVDIDQDIWKEYVYGIFTKTICECPNRNQLMKAVDIAKSLNLVELEDYGLINDRCLTELEPENLDGTTTVGIWFKPLPDDIAHQISKKFKLYRDPKPKQEESNGQ